MCLSFVVDMSTCRDITVSIIIVLHLLFSAATAVCVFLAVTWGSLVLKGDEEDFCLRNGFDVESACDNYSDADMHVWHVVYSFITLMIVFMPQALFWRLYLQPRLQQIDVLRRAVYDLHRRQTPHQRSA